MDPIVKLRYTYVGNTSQAVALKKSGKVDLYYLGIRRDTPDEIFNDIDISFDTIYLEQIVDNQSQITGISTALKAKISF